MRRIFFVLIITLLGGLTVYRLTAGLNTEPFARWDEQTNVAVVKNSLSRASPPVLLLSDEPFFEKPPLWFLITEIVVSWAGPSAASYRLISVLAGAGIVMLTTVVAWRWWGTISGIIAWVTLIFTNQLFLTNPGGYFSTHTLKSADADALFIFFMLLAFVALHNASKPYRYIVAGLASGLAVLTKSPLGLVPLVVATVLWLPARKNLTGKSVISAWIIASCIALPWYVYMVSHFGSPFVETYFGYHLATRILTPIEGHTSSWWHYIQLITDHRVFFSWELMTWSALLVFTGKIKNDSRLMFALLTTLILILIPTVIQTRLAWYILPVYPFAALTIAGGMGHTLKKL